MPIKAKTPETPRDARESEAVLLREIAATDIDTFMYQLNKRNIFHRNRFRKLIDATAEFLALQNDEENTEQLIQICQGLLVIFQHTLFLFFCHESKFDLFSIRNMKSGLSPKVTSGVYSAIRQTTPKLIEKLASHSRLTSKA